jgi:microcystin-dependent protein
VVIPYLGEIRLFVGHTVAANWALCKGQILSCDEHPELFGVLGCAYGGDGVNTFALPNFEGRTPIHHGQGPGLTPRRRGETGGQAAVTLTLENLPPHSHGRKGFPHFLLVSGAQTDCDWLTRDGPERQRRATQHLLAIRGNPLLDCT